MRRASLAVLFLTVLVDLIGFGIVLPLLPFYARRYGATELEVGLLYSIYSLMQFLFVPLWGRLSDRIGRRPVILISVAGSVFSYTLFALARSVELLFLARMFAGVAGANLAVAQAYIADVTPPEARSRNMALIGAAFGLGFVLGPAIGGTFIPLGYAVPPLVAAGLAVLNWIMAFRFLPEPPHRSLSTERRTRILNVQAFIVFARRPLLGRLLVGAFLLPFAQANMYGIFPLLGAEVLGFSDRQVSYLFMYVGLLSVLVQGGVMRWLARRVSDPYLFAWGVVATAIGYGMLPFWHDLSGVLLLLALVALGSVATPALSALTSRAAHADEQGTVLGLSQSLSSLGRTLGPAWGGVWYGIHHGLPFWSAALALLLALLINRPGLYLLLGAPPSVSASVDQ
jgi:DHA1 family tetracycline resistance protein-like MFS transporter|nr:MAG: tetracycline resistance MFS efflux pump [Bacteroidota bacterium]